MCGGHGSVDFETGAGTAVAVAPVLTAAALVAGENSAAVVAAPVADRFVSVYVAQDTSVWDVRIPSVTLADLAQRRQDRTTSAQAGHCCHSSLGLAQFEHS
jgi:hypothetical protein